MTVCGGPRERIPCVWRRIPLARTVAAPGPGSVFIRSNNSLVHALLAVFYHS